MMKSREKIIRRLQSTLSPSRYQHTLGVEKTAIDLAKFYQANEEQVSIAGLLHDCAKNIPYQVMKEYCKSYKINLDGFKDFPQILHSFLGARIAEKEYNITNQDIINAIRYHTTGRPDMTLIEKIIFLSDYIEPGRKPFDGLKEVREMAYVDLDKAVYMTLKNTINYLEELDSPIHPLTIDSEIFYRQKSNSRRRIMSDMKKAANMAVVAVEAIDDKLGEEIKIIDISQISTLADYFIIAHGKNKPQIQAIIDQVEDKMHENDYKILNKEGYQTASWVLLDYANIIVHVFNKDDRLFYDLERIWADGKEITLEQLKEMV